MADRKNMGIGVIGQPETVIKRKFRFTFEISGFCNNESNVVPEYFVKNTARPNLNIDETELNHLNGKTWIPGKAAWETISVTYVDAAHDQMKHLYNWLATVYDFTNPVALTMGNKKDWNAVGVLNIYDGCGTILEKWELQNMFPTSVNFGDMDYSSSEEATIEMTLRYSDVRYTSFCPAFTPESCCSGCDSTSTSVGVISNTF